MTSTNTQPAAAKSATADQTPPDRSLNAGKTADQKMDGQACSSTKDAGSCGTKDASSSCSTDKSGKAA